MLRPLRNPISREVLRTISFISLTLLGASSAHGMLIRSVDGTLNNIDNPTWGEANTALLRLTPAAYADGLDAPRGGSPSDLANPRTISNRLSG